MNGSRVQVPDGMSRPFQVYVNGVEQTEGADFEVAGAWIVFAHELVPPNDENARSVFRGFFFGRYRTEHVVDVACQVGGQSHVFSRLPVEPPA
ncbi:MAG TPA: hypothetical protein VN615_06265 [Gaiellales bacterium]|nr:hypothetical protein [Gaiellales bacterium]